VRPKSGVQGLLLGIARINGLFERQSRPRCGGLAAYVTADTTV